MSNLTSIDKKKLEKLFQMSSGYVLDFSDRTFAEFFNDFKVDIHSEKYKDTGDSKAKKLRKFWRIEPDDLVGRVLQWTAGD